MLTSAIATFFPGLAPRSRTARTKPYYLQSFSYFSKHVYWIFLLYCTWVMFSKSGIACDFSASEEQENNDIAEFICLMEDGYNVRLRDVQGSPKEMPSLVQTRFQSYHQQRPHVTGEIFPLISAHNASSSNSYQFYQTYMWLDFLILLQIFLFFIPEVLWDRQRWNKEDSMFEELEWNVPDVDYELSIEDIDSLLKTLDIQELNSGKNVKRADKCEKGSLSEENYTGTDSDSNFDEDLISDVKCSPPAIESLTQIYDPRMAKLFNIAQSNFVISLVEVIFVQFGCIVVMTILWDNLLAHSFASYNFTLFGFRLLDYWITYWKMNGQMPYYVDYPGEVLFPMLLKCTYPFIGNSGTRMKEDYLCVISGNYLMEKMVIVTWLYYACFIIVLLYALLTDIILPAFPFFRQRIVRSLLRDHGLPKKLQQFEKQCCKKGDHDSCDVPYQVAVFAGYLARNIGPIQTATVMKKFTFVNAHRLKSLEEIRSKLEELRERKAIEAEELGNKFVCADSLYEHYLNNYRRARNHMHVLKDGDTVDRLFMIESDSEDETKGELSSEDEMYSLNSYYKHGNN